LEREKKSLMTETNYTQSADFRSVYAQITRFRLTQWDIGLVFGRIKSVNQADEAGVLELHTDVSLSFASAKILAMYLVLNIAAIEAEKGIVKIPAVALQPDIDHLADAPILDLVSEATRIRAIAAEPVTPAPTMRPN
jgi:hypothetical protein